MRGLGDLVESLMLRWDSRAAKMRREAARVAGVRVTEESRSRLEGWIGTLRVSLEPFFRSEGRGTRIAIWGEAMPAGLTVQPEGVPSTLRAVRGVREVEVGHDTFDAAAWVEGNPTLARAVLDARTRQSLRGLFDGRLERPGKSPFFASGGVHDGALLVDVLEAPPRAPSDRREPGEEPSVHLTGPEHLGEALAATIALARRLETPADVPRRLLDNLRSDPVAGVRLQLLATLLREFPSDPATREALLAARVDPDADVRLRAGVALGAEGREILLAIAGGEGAPDETTQRAVAALGWRLTTAEAEAVLRNSLLTGREATAQACLRALGQRRGARVVPMLAKVLAVTSSEKTAVAAAEALGMTGDPAAQPALVAALGSAHEPVRLAAARALGGVGTTAAVVPLREADDGGDAEMHRAVRQAIGRIQWRLTGARRGQLSLAEGESGQLSLAGDEGGRLTLAGPAAGTRDDGGSPPHVRAGRTPRASLRKRAGGAPGES